jgi:hypothetical protein
MTEQMQTGGSTDGIGARLAGAAGQVVALTKDNAAALVASGKVLHGGLKEMGEVAVADGHKTLAVFCDDLRSIAQARTASDVLQLQSQAMQRNTEAAMAALLRANQSLFDIATRSAEPLSTRFRASFPNFPGLA